MLEILIFAAAILLSWFTANSRKSWFLFVLTGVALSCATLVALVADWSLHQIAAGLSGAALAAILGNERKADE